MEVTQVIDVLSEAIASLKDNRIAIEEIHHDFITLKKQLFEKNLVVKKAYFSKYMESVDAKFCSGTRTRTAH